MKSKFVLTSLPFLMCNSISLVAKLHTHIAFTQSKSNIVTPYINLVYKKIYRYC